MQITSLISISGDIANVFEKVATTQGLTGWLGDASFKVNQQFGSVRLQLWDEVDFVVTESISPLQIAWHCTSGGHSWFETDIVFGFQSAGKDTVVTLSHTGWSAGADQFAQWEAAWPRLLQSLCSLVESGQGMPGSVAGP